MVPVHYHTGKSPPNSIDWKRLAVPIEHATMALARYDSFLGIIPDESILLSPMLVQEAVTSSRIEGTHATVSDVLVYEAGGANFDSSKSDDVLEVVNYRHALLLAEKMIKDVPLSGRVLKAAHKTLLQNVRGSLKSPGMYRHDQNWIGTSDNIDEARYVPIAADKLEDAMAAWERFVNSDDIPSLVKISIAHAEFESIHPFCDGNGRVGRMIAPPHALLRRHHQAPVPLLERVLRAQEQRVPRQAPCRVKGRCMDGVVRVPPRRNRDPGERDPREGAELLPSLQGRAARVHHQEQVARGPGGRGLPL